MKNDRGRQGPIHRVTKVMLIVSSTLGPVAHADWLPKTFYLSRHVMDRAGNAIPFRTPEAACRAFADMENANADVQRKLNPQANVTYINFQRARLVPQEEGSSSEIRNEGGVWCFGTYRDSIGGRVLTNQNFTLVDVSSPCGAPPAVSTWNGSGYFKLPKNKLNYCGCEPGLSERYEKCVPEEDASKSVSQDKSAGGGQGCTLEGNPINPATGAKFMAETDYSSGNGALKLAFSRTYNTVSAGSALSFLGDLASPDRVSAMGRGWRHNYERALNFDHANTADGNPGVGSIVRVIRASGAAVAFTAQADGSYKGEADSAHKLKAVLSGGTVTSYVFTDADDDSTETYNPDGLLTKLTSRGGWGQTMAYSTATTPVETAPVPGLLLSVTDETGRQLQLRYDDASRVRELVDPAGRIYAYAYDEVGNLSTVTNPKLEVLEYKYNEPEHLTAQNNASGMPVEADLPYALTGVIDQAKKRYATYKYRADGKATSTEHAGGVLKTGIVYNEDGSAQVTDAIGTARENTYTTVLGNKLQAGVDKACAAPTGKLKTQKYDGQGNPDYTLDFNNYRTSHVYDKVRNLELSRTEGLNADGSSRTESRKITTEWHPTFRLPAKVAEPLKLTSYDYDASGNLQTRTERATTDADGSKGLSATLDTTVPARVWGYTYNGVGQLGTIDGPRTDVTDTTTLEYYTTADTTVPPKWRKGDLKLTKNAVGHIVNFNEYDQHGNVLKSTDANAIVTQYEYDELGRVKNQTVGGLKTSFTYDPRGMVDTVTTPDGKVLTHSYDDAHRLTGIKDNANNRLAFDVDAMGNRKGESAYTSADVLSRTRTRKYNALNRLEQDIGGFNPTGQITKYEYDLGGNLQKITDPLSRVTDRTYDALNRLRDSTQPVPDTGVARPKTTYGYDGQDRLTSVTDPRLLKTIYTIDGLGNTSKVVSPDTGTLIVKPDAAGNAKTSQDAKGQLTTYTYDALNRVTEALFQDGSKQKFQYDVGSNAKGRLNQITEVNALALTVTTLDIGYDTLGRVNKQSRTIAGKTFEVKYGYDTAGRLDTLTYPSLRTVKYSYDTVGRVSSVTSTPSGGASQIVVSAVQYHPFGGVSQFTYGNGQTHVRAQDKDGRASGYKLGTATYAVDYDNANQVKTIRNTGDVAQTNTYDYDGLARLKSVALPSTSYGYVYDGVGNRSKFTAGSAATAYTYPSDKNRLTGVGSATLQYDLNGSLQVSAAGTFTHDVKGRMSKLVGASSATTDYVVDAQGLRVRKTNAQGDVVYVYDEQGKLISENAPSGTVLKEYIYLGDLPVAVVAQ